MKKVWKRPQLFVLRRGKAEEKVLITCKHSSSESHSDIDFSFYRCLQAPACGAICTGFVES